MFPVKFIGEISKIINGYCDRYVVDKHSRIILEPRKDDIYICEINLSISIETTHRCTFCPSRLPQKEPSL